MKKMEVVNFEKYSDSANPFPLSDFKWQFICEGDSWYSITSLNLFNKSLLENFYFNQFSAGINFSQSGDIAGNMFSNNKSFKNALQKRFWSGIFISASGNDIIDAINVPPYDPIDGKLRNLSERILLTPEENNYSKNPHDYISLSGFNQLLGYLLYWFSTLTRWRDADESQSKARPIFLHTYSTPVARQAGALPGSSDSWLFKALSIHNIPRELHQGITNILFGRLRAFLIGMDMDSPSGYQLNHLHVFDSAAIPLEPADPESRYQSGDWVNEIHLTSLGAKKIGQPFCHFIEGRLSRYPMPS